jgi:predicted nucleotidyltransferase
MNKKLLNYLSTGDRQAINALVDSIIANYGHDIRQMVLFGSKARGDSTPDSDIDVLMVTTHDGWLNTRRLFRLGARISLDVDVLFNLHPVGQEHWDWMGEIRHPLYRAILRDGLNLREGYEANLRA